MLKTPKFDQCNTISLIVQLFWSDLQPILALPIHIMVSFKIPHMPMSFFTKNLDNRRPWQEMRDEGKTDLSPPQSYFCLHVCARQDACGSLFPVENFSPQVPAPPHAIILA